MRDKVKELLAAIEDVAILSETQPQEYLRLERAIEAVEAALASPEPALADRQTCDYFGIPLDLATTTKNLVVRFARALADKLYKAQEKYGYSDGWAEKNWMDECRRKLREHLEKGDPRDVAAYCAFLWWHGESTAMPAPADEGELRERLAKIIGRRITGPEWQRGLDQVVVDEIWPLIRSYTKAQVAAFKEQAADLIICKFCDDGLPIEGHWHYRQEGRSREWPAYSQCPKARIRSIAMQESTALHRVRDEATVKAFQAASKLVPQVHDPLKHPDYLAALARLGQKEG